nr:Arm DNA-binding domain-containing protein [Chitinophaga alhagiae]
MCRTKRMHEDGTATVFMQYCYTAEQRTLLHTGIKIPPAYWNKKQRCISDELPSEVGNHEELNIELRRQFRIAEDLVTHAIRNKMPDKGAFVRKTFTPSLVITSVEERVNEAAEKEEESKRSKMDVYYQFDEYIKSKERKVKELRLISGASC